MGVSLEDLIAAGLLRPPVALSRHYKKRDLEATLHADGSVEFGGKRYPSCSAAAAAARGTIIGGKPHTNGWSFWQLRVESGKLVPLDQVRKEFVRSTVVPLDQGRASAG